MDVYVMTDEHKVGVGFWYGGQAFVWRGHWIFASLLYSSIVRVNWLGHAVLGMWLVCVFLAESMSPTFQQGLLPDCIFDHWVKPLASYMVPGILPTSLGGMSMGRTYIRTVLKEDAFPLHKHHKSLKRHTWHAPHGICDVFVAQGILFLHIVQLLETCIQQGSSTGPLKSCILWHCTLWAT